MKGLDMVIRFCAAAAALGIAFANTAHADEKTFIAEFLSNCVYGDGFWERLPSPTEYQGVTFLRTEGFAGGEGEIWGLVADVTAEDATRAFPDFADRTLTLPGWDGAVTTFIRAAFREEGETEFMCSWSNPNPRD